jgi:hypothetical protein
MGKIEVDFEATKDFEVAKVEVTKVEVTKEISTSHKLAKIEKTPSLKVITSKLSERFLRILRPISVILKPIMRESRADSIVESGKSVEPTLDQVKCQKIQRAEVSRLVQVLDTLDPI